MYRSTIILFFLTITILSHAQPENCVWYFGNYAGLDFRSGTPVVLNDGQTTHASQTTTICDQNGKLLFYSEGEKAWNKNHEPMQNGDGLINQYSHQIAIRKPQSSSLYYLFSTFRTIDNVGDAYFSIIDMTLDNGLGTVIEKNTLLHENTGTKIAAITHENGEDIWVMLHAKNSNTFITFLLTSEGLSQPSYTSIGTTFSAAGYSYRSLKFSPDGTKLASASNDPSIYQLFDELELFDFDKATGLLSNPMLLNTPKPRGIEFSANSKLLYVSNLINSNLGPYENCIYQYDISSGNISLINASKTLIHNLPETFNGLAGMQIGPDGHIYIAKVYYEYIDIIEIPDQTGVSCNYIQNAIHLGNGHEGIQNFPYFVQNFSPSFFYENNCYGEATQFNVPYQNGIQSVVWNFGNPASGGNNSSTQLEPTHTFTQPGTYEVSLTVTYPDGPQTITRNVTIGYGDALDLGADQQVCSGEPVVLNAGSSYASYLWSNGSHNESITVSQAGNYWCEVESGSGCHSRDTVMVSV
ncbi:MAG: PKD domain-containing protein, partial [Bacteroidales bacterium]|nr:PKD domain-containing protein [Bacteroidales bacterium]